MRGFWKKQIVSVATLATFVTAYAAPAWADCANDSQCKGDRICENHQCVSPPAKAAPPAAPVPSAPPLPSTPPPPAAPPGPKPPEAGSVKVRFEGPSEALVKMDFRGVTKGECHMPCSLDLPPGDYTLRAKGFNEEIEVPGHASIVTMKKACTFCYVMGGILAGSSILLFAAGGAVVSGNHGDDKNPGFGLVAGGVVFLLSGATLIILGIAVGGGGVKVKAKDSDDAKVPRYLTPTTKPSLGLTAQGIGLTF